MRNQEFRVEGKGTEAQRDGEDGDGASWAKVNEGELTKFAVNYGRSNKFTIIVRSRDSQMFVGVGKVGSDREVVGDFPLPVVVSCPE